MPVTSIQPATFGLLLTEERVGLGLQAPNKTTLLKTLVGELFAGTEVDQDVVADAVLERENLLSTGVGYGVALPHAKTPAVDDVRVFVATVDPAIDFEAFDGEPVQIVFMMITPAQASRLHIQLLGRISRILSDESVRTRILAAGLESTVVDILTEAEASLGGA